MDAFDRHDVSQLLTEFGIALAAAVLNGQIALFCHHRLVSLGQQLFGQGRDVRHASGQRDHFWPRNYCEKSANLRNRKGVGTLRIGI